MLPTMEQRSNPFLERLSRGPILADGAKVCIWGQSQERLAAMKERVDDANPMAGGEEEGNESRADVARPARDDVLSPRDTASEGRRRCINTRVHDVHRLQKI